MKSLLKPLNLLVFWKKIKKNEVFLWNRQKMGVFPKTNKYI